MLQLSEKTESSLTKSIAGISNSLPKLSKVLELEKSKESGVWAIEPKKLHITINDPITVKAPMLLNDGEKEEKSLVKATKKPDAAAALKEETRLARRAKKEEKWRDSVKEWQGNMVGSLKKTLTDNPIVEFFKNHWGKLLIGLAILFLKPAQMKALWEGLKGMAMWLWKNGPKIFQGILDGLKVVGDVISNIFDWLFGKTEKQTEQEKLKEMEKEGPRKGIFGIGAETKDEFKARLQEQKDKVNNADDKKLVGGLGDSLFKKIAAGLGGLSLLLLKFGPKGSLFKVVELGAKGIWKTTKGLANVIKNPGQTIDNSAKFLGDKAGKTKKVASKVGGAVKNVASAGGDWFKSLMGKFGKAGKFLAKMGKSVIQGLMTSGPYGWAILGGIALGGLVWYFWDDVTRVWNNIVGTISKGFTKVKEMVTGAFGNIQGMLGGWLRGIGARMIADWIDPDGAEEGEKKKEFTFGGFMGELWTIYSGIWKKIFDLIKSIDPVEIVKSLTGGLVNLAKDALPFMKSDEEKQKDADTQTAIKTKNDTKTKAKNDEIKTKAKKGESTWYAPSTWFSSDDGKEKEKQEFFKEIKKDIKGAKRWRGKNREKKVEPINKKINDSPYRDEVLGMLSTSQLKLIGKDGLATKKHEENKLRLAARTPEQVAADDKYMRAHSGSSASDDFSGAPSPMVSPTMKADTLNQVQGENAELSSGTNAIIAPTTINNITNNYGNGGEGGTAIYGVPTAQKGNQHRHSNIK